MHICVYNVYIHIHTYTYIYTHYKYHIVFKQMISQFVNPSANHPSRCLKDHPMSANNMEVFHCFRLTSNPEYKYTRAYLATLLLTSLRLFTVFFY